MPSGEAASAAPRSAVVRHRTGKVLYIGNRDMIIVSYAVADREYAEAEAEFLLKRVAFTISFRNYAFWTPRSRVNNRGLTGDPLAPVSSFQSALMGAIGIAFRF